MNYYSFHIGDYKSHTSHLSLIEDLAYRRMLDLYYLTESPLPDVNKIARAICMRENKEEIQTIIDEFFIDTEEGYIHSRCEREIKSMNDKSGKAKASAQMRWNKKRNANASESQCERNANASKNHANASKTDANAMRDGCERNAPNPNPNINNKNNASEDFSFANIDTKGTQEQQPRIFKMFIGWTPESVTWAQTLKASQHLTKNKPFTDYHLAEFIRRNIDGQEKTEANWQRYYVNAFAKGMLDEQQATKTQQKDINHSEPPPYVIKPPSTPIYERPSPEERARQVAELKRIREADRGI